MLAFHLGAIAALFMFSWKGLAIALFLWWLTGSMGIGMCYQPSPDAPRFINAAMDEYFMAVCGTMALEGGPIAWVATHRIHHQNTEKKAIPIHPNDGGLWAHIGWIHHWQGHASQHRRVIAVCSRPAEAMKFYMWISKYHWVPLAGSGVILYAIGGWSLRTMGRFFAHGSRLHATWLVNSATHMWGHSVSSPATCPPTVFWVAVLTFGEGWHKQSPCVAAIGASRPGLVRSGHELVWDFRASSAGPSLGHQGPEIATGFRT